MYLSKKYQNKRKFFPDIKLFHINFIRKKFQDK